MVRLIPGALLLGALLGGCAGIPQQAAGGPIPRDRYEAYAGAPVHSFNYLGRFDGWRPLGRHQLAVWTGSGDGYLLSLEPPCLNLDFSAAISFTTQIAHTVTSGLDSVRVGRDRCRILEIRPLDYCGLTAEGVGPR